MSTVKRFLANPVPWSFIIFFVLLIVIQMTGARVATIPGTYGATQFGRFGTADQMEALRLEWCDDSYHQDVDCPKFGKVEVPPETAARWEADLLRWCNRVDHWHRDCPDYNYKRAEDSRGIST